MAFIFISHLTEIYISKKILKNYCKACAKYFRIIYNVDSVRPKKTNRLPMIRAVHCLMTHSYSNHSTIDSSSMSTRVNAYSSPQPFNFITDGSKEMHDQYIPFLSKVHASG